MRDLRSYTTARVSLGVSGDSLPTAPLLALRLAHARARDAVQLPLDVASLQSQLAVRNRRSLLLHSAAQNREEYLRRPDLGRRLDRESAEMLRSVSGPHSFVLVICDGLSALAVERHAVPLLDEVFQLMPAEADPVWIVSQGRVAIGDPIGEALGARAIVVLIGERPGLSSPDSLGVYLTWNPRGGCTDAARNCISNIHTAGLSYGAAAYKLVFLLHEMFRLKLSGVALKDTSSAHTGLPWPSDKLGVSDGKQAL